MAKRLTVFDIPGDPDELFEIKHSVMDPVMSRKAPEYGALVHIAVKKPDGSGIVIVNLWDSPEGSDRAMEDPEIIEVRNQLAERLGVSDAPTGKHYEVVDFMQAGQPAPTG